MTVQQPSTAEEYRRDGVVRLRRFLSQDTVTEIREALTRYIRDIAPGLPASDVTWEADGRSIRNLWRMERHDPFFQALGERPAIREIVGALVGGEPVLLTVETFNKPALTGSAVPAHQDNAYFCLAPPDALTIWIAIDPATVANGPIYYARGSHGTMLPHRASGVRGNSMGLAEPPDPVGADEFCGTLESGDALIHHCQTIHRSDPNTTDAPRCGLLLVYRAAHAGEDPVLKAAYRQAYSGTIE